MVRSYVWCSTTRGQHAFAACDCTGKWKGGWAWSERDGPTCSAEIVAGISSISTSYLNLKAFLCSSCFATATSVCLSGFWPSAATGEQVFDSICPRGERAPPSNIQSRCCRHTKELWTWSGKKRIRDKKRIREKRPRLQSRLQCGSSFSCRNSRLRSAWVDPFQPLPRSPRHGLESRHLALRHGLRRHSLRAGRADLQRRHQVPNPIDPRVPRSDSPMPPAEAQRQNLHRGDPPALVDDRQSRPPVGQRGRSCRCRRRRRLSVDNNGVFVVGVLNVDIVGVVFFVVVVRLCHVDEEQQQQLVHHLAVDSFASPLPPPTAAAAATAAATVGAVGL